MRQRWMTTKVAGHLTYKRQADAAVWFSLAFQLGTQDKHALVVFIPIHETRSPSTEGTLLNNSCSTGPSHHTVSYGFSSSSPYFALLRWVLMSIYNENAIC